jgi:hypothetical protein
MQTPAPGSPAAMSRLARAWSAMSSDRRVAALAALALLVTMFLPWYGLQSLNPKTQAIYSHDINAFGDVSFVEAAIFLVAAGVMAMLFARAEERDFNLPGGDGTIVTAAGGWAGLLIFYRVFDRPAGHGYPVGIQWGFFLAFVAAGGLAYAGWRMRHTESPEPPARRRQGNPRPSDPDPDDPTRVTEAQAPVRAPARPREQRRRAGSDWTDGESQDMLIPTSPQPRRPAPAAQPAPARGTPAAGRPRYPPAPPGAPEQLSFEDPPGRPE